MKYGYIIIGSYSDLRKFQVRVQFTAHSSGCSTRFLIPAYFQHLNDQSMYWKFPAHNWLYITVNISLVQINSEQYPSKSCKSASNLVLQMGNHGKAQRCLLHKENHCGPFTNRPEMAGFLTVIDIYLTVVMLFWIYTFLEAGMQKQCAKLIIYFF